MSHPSEEPRTPFKHIFLAAILLITTGGGLLAFCQNKRDATSKEGPKINRQPTKTFAPYYE